MALYFGEPESEVRELLPAHSWSTVVSNFPGKQLLRSSGAITFCSWVCHHARRTMWLRFEDLLDSDSRSQELQRVLNFASLTANGGRVRAALETPSPAGTESDFTVL